MLSVLSWTFDSACPPFRCGVNLEDCNESVAGHLSGCVQEVFERDIDSGISEVVQGLLTIDPQERMTAEAALRMPFFNPGPSGKDP